MAAGGGYFDGIIYGVWSGADIMVAVHLVKVMPWLLSMVLVKVGTLAVLFRVMA